MFRVCISPMLFAVTGASAVFAPAYGQDDGGKIRALEAKLAAQEERISQLERLLSGGQTAAESLPSKVDAPVYITPLAAVAAGPQTNPLDISGDFRIREEFNWSDADMRDRTRTVIRARMRASYAVNDHVLVGAQLTTGDANDPNTTDVTLGDFVNDQNVSLDQVYARLKLGNLQVYGGKFPMIFRRTDLVWDGDVNPQGIGANYAMSIGDNGARLEARVLYFLINESSTAKGSDMLGGQLAVAMPLGSLQAELSAAYYDYRLRSLAGADPGDFRSNLLTPGGSYLSDFNLADVVATLTHKGLGERWPVGITGEYVKNFGSFTAEDSGYSFEAFIGQARNKNDMRFTYGHMVADVDAVFAAFSHDNIAIATNYRLHSLSADYVVLDNTILNFTYYMYRPKAAAYAGVNQADDWLSRLRVNLLFNF